MKGNAHRISALHVCKIGFATLKKHLKNLNKLILKRLKQNSSLEQTLINTLSLQHKEKKPRGDRRKRRHRTTRGRSQIRAIRVEYKMRSMDRSNK